ncbi:ATP-binding protein, partial [Methylobacterium radiotolerans]
DRVTELPGQAERADGLAARLRQPGARIWFRGPPGSGKSTIANLVAARLGPHECVIRLKGDVTQTGTRFLCALRALEGTRRSKLVRDALPSALVAPLRAIPFGGGALAEWARIAATTVNRVRPEFLNGDQLDVLEGFQKLAAGSRAYIVIDDVGWLDIETTQLVAALAYPEVQKAFPFAEAASILFVENSEAAPGPNASILDQLRPSDVVEHRRIDQAAFEQALLAFGWGRPLDKDLVRDLYAISSGHLEIARQIVKLDAGVDLASLLARGDATSLMAELLDKRIGALRGATALLRLLSIAACAGSVFSETELHCAFMDPEAFPAALQAACREDLLIEEDDALRFAHDVVRAAAERLGSSQAADLHAKLAECVKRLRPGDYHGRLRHLRLAGQTGLLGEIAFAAAMQSVRGETLHPTPVAAELGPLGDILDSIRDGYRLMDAGEHRRALDVVLPHYDGTASLVQGEIVALVALNKIKLRTGDAYNEAVALLERWREARDEPELWQRLMSILSVALANAGEAERANQMHAVLVADLSARSIVDGAARTRLEAINRKADMFFGAELSEKHIRRAAAWFGPQVEGGMPRHAFEHTACHINLSGVLFTRGRFAAAAESAEVALSSIATLQAVGLRTAEPYKAFNNYAIASCRAGIATPEEAGAAIDVVIPPESRRDLRDRCLILCNRGALALLAGRVEEANAALGLVWAQVRDRDLDGYYTLYAGSNLAVSKAVGGDRRGAAKLLREIEPHLSVMPKWVRRAHQRRHAMMLKAFGDTSVRLPAEFDAYPFMQREPDDDQDPWWSIGRGLLLSDIQVWSEG